MKKEILIGIITCLSVVIFSSCSKSNSSYNTTTSSTSNMVSIANMSFVAATTNVNTGTIVTWTNNDNVPHTVTADDNSFTSGNLNKGDTYSHTFSNIGTIPYHCKIHPGMTATVTVK